MSKSSKARASQPKRLKKAQDIIIRARCSKELKERVDAWAKKNNANTSIWLREAVEHYLIHLESGGERLLQRPDIHGDSPHAPD